MILSLLTFNGTGKKEKVSKEHAFLQHCQYTKVDRLFTILTFRLKVLI